MQSLITGVRGQFQPREVNGYTLVERLGHGGTSIVYKAEKEGKLFCVRELRYGKRTDDLSSHKVVELFGREYETLAKLDHERIPRVYEMFPLEEGRNIDLYMVEDYIPGKNLKDLVEENGPLGEEKIVDVMLQLTDILSYLHQQEPAVVHRDIKPSNIMLKGDDAYLIDFGAVQQRLVETMGGSTMFGTFGYAPLEIIGGKAVPQSDLYMLGTTMLHLKSGVDAADLMDGVRLNYQGKVKFDNPSLGVLVEMLTEQEIEDRPKSVQEVADYLQRIKQGDVLTKRIEHPGLWSRLVARLVGSKTLQHLVRTRRGEVDQARQTAIIFPDKSYLGYNLGQLSPVAAANGTKRTQDNWFPWWEKQEDEVMASMGDLYRGFKVLQEEYEQGGEAKVAASKIIDSLRDDFDWSGKRNWLISSTRLLYSKHSLEGTIIHHYNCKNKDLVQEVFLDEILEYRGVLLGEVLAEDKGLKYIRTLFDTEDDAKQIMKTMEFISNKSRDEIKVWTAAVNDAWVRSDRSERAAGFNFNDNEFHVNGKDYTYDGQGCSRGVRRA